LRKVLRTEVPKDDLMAALDVYGQSASYRLKRKIADHKAKQAQERQEREAARQREQAEARERVEELVEAK